MRTDRVLVLFNRTNSYENFLQIPFRQCGFSCGWSTGAAERIGDRTRCTEKKVTVKFWAKINLVLTSDPTRLSIRAGTSSKCFSIRAGTSSKFSGFVGHWVLGLWKLGFQAQNFLTYHIKIICEQLCSFRPYQAWSKIEPGLLGALGLCCMGPVLRPRPVPSRFERAISRLF